MWWNITLYSPDQLQSGKLQQVSSAPLHCHLLRQRQRCMIIGTFHYTFQYSRNYYFLFTGSWLVNQERVRQFSGSLYFLLKPKSKTLVYNQSLIWMAKTWFYTEFRLSKRQSDLVLDQSLNSKRLVINAYLNAQIKFGLRPNLCLKIWFKRQVLF